MNLSECVQHYKILFERGKSNIQRNLFNEFILQRGSSVKSTDRAGSEFRVSFRQRDSSRRCGDTPAYESAVLARARVTAEGLFPEGNRWHVVTGANYVVDKRRSVSAGGPVHVGRVLPVGRPPPRPAPPPPPRPDAAMRGTAERRLRPLPPCSRHAGALPPFRTRGCRSPPQARPSYLGAEPTPMRPRRPTGAETSPAGPRRSDASCLAPGDVVVCLARAGSIARSGSAR